MTIFAFIHRHDHRKPLNSKSGFKGVIYTPTTVNRHGERVPLKRPWKSYIRQHGICRTIGYFSTAEQAARAYNTVAKRIKGETTYLNPG